MNPPMGFAWSACPVNDTVLGVGEFAVSGTPGAELKTFALGSCVALLLYDLKAKMAALAHIALPHSSINPERAQILPAYFSDTGIPAVLNAAYSASRRKGTSGLIVKLVGGANIIQSHSAFNIGSRNLDAIRTALSSRGLTPMAEDVGGAISRTVSIAVDTGKVLIQSPGRGSWEL